MCAFIYICIFICIYISWLNLTVFHRREMHETFMVPSYMALIWCGVIACTIQYLEQNRIPFIDTCTKYDKAVDFLTA